MVMRILLVEDDRMIDETVSVALKDAACAVDWVMDGAAASVVLEQGEHQAVLLDLGLPKRDGLEVLRRLRRAGKLMAVIVNTARDGVDDRIKGLDFGAGVVEIVDSGPGIAPAERECVFDAFHRGPDSGGEGSGLGLAIAREAAARLGGVVSLHDRPDGAGLVFRYRQGRER